MIYISLPVHTQPGAILSQLRNFAHFFPEAMVVLHVSAEARFTLDHLTAAIKAGNHCNALVNPRRAPTAWGNILQAHLTNIAFIRNRRDASRICLHASNDMLVRPGVQRYLAGGHNFCNRRIVQPGTRWRFGAAALADLELAKLRHKLGNIDVIGSQIEGSAYEADVMFAVAELIENTAQQRPSLPYPREEVWFSTLAHGLQAHVDGKPYVFSELHRFDRVFWQVQKRLDRLTGTGGAASMLLRRCVEYGMIKTGFHRIDRRWVDRIARDDTRFLSRYQTLDDGNNIWQVFERHGLFGVKRVPRRVDAGLRRYIESLGEATSLEGRCDQRDTCVTGLMDQRNIRCPKRCRLQSRGAVTGRIVLAET